MDEKYIYIPRPFVVIACVLLLLGCGIMVGASVFPVHVKEPCKARTEKGNKK